VPDPPASSAGGKSGAGAPRIREWQRAGKKPPLPPCRARHLADYLFEIGPDMAAGMGVVPISWQEISAWQANSHVRLTAWEARLIRRLSGAYVRERNDARDPAWPQPMTASQRIDGNGRKHVERKLRKLLG